MQLVDANSGADAGERGKRMTYRSRREVFWELSGAIGDDLRELT